MKRIQAVFSMGAMHGGGSERQLISILRHLNREHFEPFLYLVYRSGPLLEDIPDDVPVAAFEERVAGSRLYVPGLMHARRVRDYAAFLSEVRADVSYDRTFLMTMIAAAGAQRAGVPNVSTIVTNPELGFAPVAGRFQWFKRRLLGKLYNRSARVLAVSDGAREAACRFYGIRPDIIQTLANGVDVNRIEQQAQRDPSDDWWTSAKAGNAIRLVTAGRLNHEKGFHLLIDAVARLTQAMPERPVRLAILGEGTHRDRLQKQIDELQLANNVRLVGFRDDAPAWYRSADLFVLPSLMEGMPNVLLEAMVCGTAVVSFDCESGPREILDHGRLGELIETGSVDALVNGIRKVISDPQSTRSRAMVAQESIRTGWSVEASVRSLETILRQCAGQLR
ncbi:MAG: glycosyltransferase [Planctomycetaceae bacterium]|nr:glycosyltransferase [Planctomycetaceae bacterium]